MKNLLTKKLIRTLGRLSHCMKRIGDSKYMKMWKFKIIIRDRMNFGMFKIDDTKALPTRN